MVFVFLFLTTSLCITDCRFNNDLILLFFMAEWYSIAYRYCIFFINSSVGLLGFFHLLVIVNSAAVSIGVHMPFWIMVFLRYMPSNGVCRLLTGISLFFLELYSWSAPFWQFLSTYVCNKGKVCNDEWGRVVADFLPVMLLWMIIFLCHRKVPSARADRA